MSEDKVILVAESDDTLIRSVPIEKDKVASRRILKAPGVRMVRLSIDAGQALTEHTTAVPILITVLAGRAVLTADGSSTDLVHGAIAYVEPNVPHSLEALEASHVALTLLDGHDAVRLGHGTGRKREHGKPADTRAAETSEQAPSRVHNVSNNLVLASSGADSTALDSITRRHAELSGRLATLTARLLDAAASGTPDTVSDTRDALIGWFTTRVTPQLAAEASVLYPAAEDVEGGAELVAVFRDDIDQMGRLLDQIENDDDVAGAAAAAVSLRVLVSRHLNAESERLLPLLAGAPNHSLAALWTTVEFAAGGQEEPDTPVDDHAAKGNASDAHLTDHADCTCGEVDGESLPELDVRTVPHAIRHATVFGALDAVNPGGGLVLIAPHDPLPLLAQIEQRSPQRFGVSYLQRGPDDWRLQFLRSDAPAAAR